MSDSPRDASEPRVVSLRDDPAERDHFGGHVRVAQAISELIETEDGGRTIGLEGSWGSGKSTIVNLLRKNVGSSTRVFVYDAWAHERDPLRRSFLEDLGDYLSSDEGGKWIDEKWWSRRKSDLTRTTETETTSRVTPNGRWLIGSLLLAPIGLILLGFWADRPLQRTEWGQVGLFLALLPLAFAFFFFTVSRWPKTAKLLAIAANASCASLMSRLEEGLQVGVLRSIPGLILVGSLVAGLLAWTSTQRQWLNEGESDKASPNDPNHQTSEADPWALLVRAGVTESTRTEMNDPTSLQFESAFRELVSIALGGDNRRRLVIVLDNLDRVDPQTAKKTLATLQIFFDLRRRHGQSKEIAGLASRLWVLLPYDRDGLRSLWEDSHRVLDHFLDKIREVRFEVGPLILSDWRQYLEDKLREAFPDEDTDAIAQAGLVFVDARLDPVLRGPRSSSEHVAAEDDDNSGLPDPDVAPTPRELIRFVNLMGVVRRQRREMALEQVAYYAFLRDRQIDVARHLLSGGLDQPWARTLLGHDLTSWLADLHYNVEEGEGEQILLGDRIDAAARNGSGDELRELLNLHGNAFWRVFEHLDLSAWSDAGGTAFGMAGAAFASGDMLSDLPAEVRNKLRQQIAATEQWALDGEGCGSGLAALLERIDDPAMADAVVERLSDESEESANTRVRLRETLALLQGLTWFGDVNFAERRIVIPGSFDDYFAALDELVNVDESWWPVFRSSTDSKQTARFITEGITDLDGTVPAWVKRLQVLTHQEDSIGWSRVRKHIVDTLSGGDLYTPLIQSALEVAALDESKYTALHDDFLRLLHQAYSENDVRTAALCAFHYLRAHPFTREAAEEPTQELTEGKEILNSTLQSDPGYRTLADALTQIAMREIEVVLRYVLTEGKMIPWAREALKAAAHEHLVGADHVLDPEPLRGLEFILADEDGTSVLASLVGSLFRREDLITPIVEHENPLRYARLATIINRLAEQEPDLERISSLRQMNLKLLTCLENLSAAEWLELLGRSDPAVDLALDLMDAGHELALDSPFSEALVKYGRQVAEGAHQPQARWSALPQLLPDADQRELAVQLLADLNTGANEPVDPAYFALLGDFLRDHPAAREDPRLLEIGRRAVIVGDEPTQRWLLEIVEEPGFLDEHDEGVVFGLRAALDSRLSDPRSDVPEVTVRLGRACGLPMRVGLVGYFGLGNYGDELFLQVHEELFRAHKITVLRGCDGLTPHDPHEIGTQDVVIVGGGDLVRPWRHLPRYWDHALLQRPVLIVGVGVDLSQPPDSEAVQRLAEFFGHANVRFISARDEPSRQWIVANLQPALDVGVHADLAASLQLLERQESKQPTIGLVLRAGTPLDKSSVDQAVTGMKDLGYLVRLIVLGIGATAAEDLNAVGHLGLDDALVIPESIEDISEELSSCDAVLSQRFHGCLAAMLMGIPTIGLQPSDKIRALFDHVGRPDEVITLDDPALLTALEDLPEPLTPDTIKELRVSAEKAGRDLLATTLRETLRAKGATVEEASPYSRYGYGFLDGPDQRAARRMERSPRLLRNPGATLRLGTELAWYRNEISRFKGREYLASLDQIIDDTPLLADLPQETQAVLCIPVAGTSESQHIYGALSLYARQDPGVLDRVVVILYVNYPDDASLSAGGTRNLEHTINQIRSAQADFPDLMLAPVIEAFDHRLPSAHDGIIGYLGRRLYDLSMMSVRRAIEAKRMPADREILLIRNDADTIGMSRNYLRRLVDAGQSFLETDVFQGGVRWGTNTYRDYPGYGVVMAMKEALRALAHRHGADYQAVAGTNGSNVAIRMSTLAAVGGVGNSDYYGAGGDDVELGLRAHAARTADSGNSTGRQNTADRRVFRYVSGAQVDATGERTLATYLQDQPITHSWNDFNTGPGGYLPRHRENRNNAPPTERFGKEVIVERVEWNVNALAEWYPDHGLMDAALRLVVGARNTNGAPVYEITNNAERPHVMFTSDGRQWLADRLEKTREGTHDPYGRRVRRSLYGELSNPPTVGRMISAL